MVEVIKRCLVLLERWQTAAEKYWYPIPGRDHLGCYGSGYNSWGVQTNQKYAAAMAGLGMRGEQHGIRAEVTDRARSRALAALRFSLASHLSGEHRCTDGTRWGHTWISGLGLERMMHGARLLDSLLTDQDRAALRRVLTSEAEWLATDYGRADHKGVHADLWNASGRNAPESNIWNGALLWRSAVMYPDHPQAGQWQARAHAFLMNGISVPADAGDTRMVAGKKVRDWHVGANFFPHFALDHHGYLNVGYMVICLSNIAMLHFDLTGQELPLPESLYHHAEELWQVVRHLVAPNGRLIRIGGDSRVRYGYCQEYLLPVLVFAGRHLHDSDAAGLINAQVRLIGEEAEYNKDGSFFGNRLAAIASASDYYYTRLESDRACCLGMAAAYGRNLIPGITPAAEGDRAEPDFQWQDPEHGAVVCRTPSRFVSFAWRAHALGQGLCFAPEDSHAVEWQHNLGGYVRFQNEKPATNIGHNHERELADYAIRQFDGGFITAGSIREGCHTAIAEGWTGHDQARHRIVFAALPDQATVVGMQFCRTGSARSYIREVAGLHLNLPNDLYNGFCRRLETGQGTLILKNPAGQDLVQELNSTWVLADNRLGAAGLYGAKGFTIDQSGQRRGGTRQSLYVDRILWPHQGRLRAADPGTVVLDAGWAVMTGATRETIGRLAGTAAVLPGGPEDRLVRGVRVAGRDGREYVVVANFKAETQAVPMAEPLNRGERFRDLAGGDEYDGQDAFILTLEPGEARVFEVL